MRQDSNNTAGGMAGARIFGPVLALSLVGTIVALVLAAVRTGDGRTSTGQNELGNPPGMVDRLDLIDSRGAWESGTRDRVALVSAAVPGVRLDDVRDDAFPRTGRWTSPEVPTPFAFTELIPSWNVAAPKDTGLRLEVRVRARGGARWSPWLHLGSWGRTPGSGGRTTRCREGEVNVDYLALRRPADAYQVRVEFSSFSLDRAASPSVRRLAVSYSGVVADAQRRDSLAGPAAAVAPASWARDLPVPFRTQKDAPKPLSGEICSPACLSMVMAYCGVDRPTVENALAIYDPEHEIFGNWGRAVARAGELGLDGWLTRFRDWQQVKAAIAAGQPVIASIRFNAGEFPSAVLPETSGHLIVVRGFTAAGDVIVNDPASRDRGNGVVYRADELARAWFGHGGVGYVIRPGTGGPAPRVVADAALAERRDRMPLTPSSSRYSSE